MIGGKYAEMVLLGFRNMWGYKLRTFLSMLSISFGIASVIAIFATAEGAQREILAQIGLRLSRFGIPKSETTARLLLLFAVSEADVFGCRHRLPVRRDTECPRPIFRLPATPLLARWQIPDNHDPWYVVLNEEERQEPFHLHIVGSVFHFPLTMESLEWLPNASPARNVVSLRLL